ncbi:MAG: hypothetical protein KOO63_16880 [Bacteroidales bacterium]|nr:hypothetical protein [Candidatus Latescibacterota bacterium]
MNDSFPKKPLTAVIAFSIAMAFLEAAVVIYLRELYYPEGFCFPLKMLPSNILVIELVRETSTIIILAAIGWLSAKSSLGRFAGFMIAFGVWDIFYYVFLKLSLDWPAGLLDWDLLFLIPLPWIGPVIAPVLVSICLIGSGVLVWLRESQNRPVRISRRHWILEVVAGLVIIGSFLTNIDVVIAQDVPDSFRWEIFSIGLLSGVIVFIHAVRKSDEPG